MIASSLFLGYVVRSILLLVELIVLTVLFFDISDSDAISRGSSVNMSNQISSATFIPLQEHSLLNPFHHLSLPGCLGHRTLLQC